MEQRGAQTLLQLEGPAASEMEGRKEYTSWSGLEAQGDLRSRHEALEVESGSLWDLCPLGLGCPELRAPFWLCPPLPFPSPCAGLLWAQVTLCR